LAVGVQVPVNVARIATADPVDRHGGGGGLQELDCLGTRDVEALPIQGEILALLLDGGGIAGLFDRALARDDGSTGGPRVRPVTASGQYSGCQEEGVANENRATASLAAAVLAAGGDRAHAGPTGGTV